MHPNVSPVYISHDQAVAEILSATGADPTKAPVVADILRRRSPELLTLSQAASRFGVSGRTLLINAFSTGRQVRTTHRAAPIFRRQQSLTISPLMIRQVEQVNRIARPETDSASHDDAVFVPPEVSLTEAARLLNVDRKTATKYLRAGMLPWLDIAPPGSARPTYRIKLASVLAIRSAYRSENPNPNPAAPKRNPSASGPYKLKHITLRR